AEVASSRVQTDGNIITSQGPGTAMEFALEIIRTVKGEAAADEIRKELLMI
ncbi:MAG: DJ-1/PfpI family protein, partial [Clostridia bacterium]|nr:DJ-1/PfpI family protein [Clostridia bacterium]